MAQKAKKHAKAPVASNVTNRIQQRLHVNFGGLVGSMLFLAISFAPSLLPRGYILQGLLSGISFAIGYGLGVAVAFFLHMLPRRYRFTLSTFVKKIVAGVLVALVLVSLFLGFHWQQQIRDLTESTAAPTDYPLRIMVLAVLIALLLIWMSRGIHHFAQYLGRKLNRILPPKLALYGGALLSAIVLIFLVNGVILNAFFGTMNYVFGLTNDATPSGIYQPNNSLMSGSPQSVIDWNTLGEKGREFVATAPQRSAISSYSSPEPANQPSRLYVGLESAPNLQDRVHLLIKELDRTNAKDRTAILIAIPTGSGGVNAKSVQTVEYLYHGDTTTLAIQYSYLPSWISFLADQQKVRDAGQAVTEGVYDWWSKLDPNHRPKLLMYGESLGTLGADGAFSSASDMHARMNGVLLVGPPNANQLWRNIEANRDKGTPEVLPIYQNGQVVRFSNGTKQLVEAPAHQPWDNNRVGFVQHASDPVVWWAPALLLHKPDWLSEPRGTGVLPNLRWYPFVTFWQVAGDLPFAFNTTAGHGHRYGNSMVDSWIGVLNANLTKEQVEQLHKIIDGVEG